MKGVYIHIPFCRSICNYCDFYKMVVSDKFKNEYVDYLIKDIDNTFIKYNLNDVNTIYIGGGTPSCLPLETLEKIFVTLLKYVELQKLDELTIEANPEDLTSSFIRLLKKYFVSRISIGVQTFDINNYNILGRCTNYDDIKHKIDLLKENGIDNYSFDLIYAIPNSSIESLECDLEKIISLKPNHISTYSLILEERTILYHQYLKQNVHLIDEKLDAKMYDLIRTKLYGAGYTQYEISNFAIPRYESKHNLIYWNYDEYYGIGTAASSFYQNKRVTRVSNIKKYYELIDDSKEPYLEKELLDKDRLMEDYVMLGLRKTSGINLNDFKKRFGISVFDVFKNINTLVNDNLIKIENDFLKINFDYLYISNFIISKLLFD